MEKNLIEPELKVKIRVGFGLPPRGDMGDCLGQQCSGGSNNLIEELRI